MIHTYHIDYLSDAQENMGLVLDYLATSCGATGEEIDNILKHSKILALFSRGNPHYLCGLSGIELAKLVAEESNLKEKQKYSFPMDANQYRWAGYYLTYYSWYTCKPFDYIFNYVSFDTILKMYPAYHQMNVMNFVESFDKIVSKDVKEIKLKLLRKLNNLSQSELAEKSNVSLRSIQLYEQKVNDINKAQAKTLYQLAKALNVNIEDLLDIE